MFNYKPWLGMLFLLAYVVYLLRELRGAQVLSEEVLEPLKLHPKGDPGLLWPLVQTSLALIAIAIASKVFVGQLETIGIWAGLSPQLVALLLSPVATELPETMNALIWVRQGKERLALANISGAMMIQATIPTALGLFFTSWVFSRELIVSGVITMAAVAILLGLFSKNAVNARCAHAARGAVRDLCRHHRFDVKHEGAIGKRAAALACLLRRRREAAENLQISRALDIAAAQHHRDVLAGHPGTLL